MERYRRVFAYVDAHAEDKLPVAELAQVAGLSRFHFQRQFAALFGIGVHEYVTLVRFHRSSLRLAFRTSSILEIALDSGYESHAAFTRAFKAAFGQAPAEFRANPDWTAWEDQLGRLLDLRAQQGLVVPVVTIEERAPVPVMALEHREGPLFPSLQRFIAWRRLTGLTPRTSATYNLFHDDASVDLCAAGRAPGLVEKTIRGGRHAVVSHVGVEASLWQTVDWLYAHWLPASGEALRDDPLCVRRVRFFPDVAEHEAVTEVLLPLT